MKKNQYIAPKVTIVVLSHKHGILLSASQGGFLLLEDGGLTSNSETIITSADVKQHGYSVWDDDWSN